LILNTLSNRAITPSIAKQPTGQYNSNTIRNVLDALDRYKQDTRQYDKSTTQQQYNTIQHNTTQQHKMPQQHRSAERSTLGLTLEDLGANDT
jgi:hypothetical protein